MKRTLITTCFLTSFSFGLVAQDKIPIIEKYEPRSILKIGTAPIGFMNHSGVDLFNLSLAYEFKVAPRLTGQVQVISSLFGAQSFDNWDIESFSRQFFSSEKSVIYKKNAVSMNIDVRYYLSKKGYRQFNGAYLGLRVNNLFTNGLESHEGGFTRVRTSMLPAIGLYIGYQKTFKNNLFIDGNIGFVPENQFRYKQNDFGLPMDVNLSFGYRFKSIKNRQEKKLKNLKKK